MLVLITQQKASVTDSLTLAALGSGLSGTIASGKKVLSLLDEKPLLLDVTEGINVSMEFPKNKIIGIQGKSGSGKSTLLKLFMRFWKTGD